MTEKELQEMWLEDLKTFSNLLVGRKIVGIRVMTEKEAKDFYWYKRPFVLELDNGTVLVPQSDDEGNDGGAVLILGKDVEKVLYTH